MVTIDKELCIGCGACAKDCPGKAIRIEEGKANIVRACIQCGHCVAVCPVKAAAIPEYDMEDVEEYIPESFHVNPENILHAIKFRRSIRNFKEKPLEPEKLNHILDAGRYTATARNLQACTFVLVQEQLEEFKRLVWEEMPAIVEKLNDSAPVYGKMFGRFYEKWKENPKKDNLFFNTTSFLLIAAENPLDGGLAAANMENVAVAEGGGVLYSGYLMRIVSASPRLRDWLGIGEKPTACCMLLGYPAVTYKRTAPRKEADIIRK